MAVRSNARVKSKIQCVMLPLAKLLFKNQYTLASLKLLIGEHALTRGQESIVILERLLCLVQVIVGGGAEEQVRRLLRAEGANPLKGRDRLLVLLGHQVDACQLIPYIGGL